jgi:P4 family phage/plasmid primase-like protien
MAVKKLEALLEAFQGNAYPAMLDHLGEHLGVTADSLRRLELGWAPIVQFKKGPNFQGWWAIPERDARGEVEGLSLRSQGDHKVMYPGSKHGLVYAINPQHERGSTSYQAGAHNWVRLKDAGITCPICDKPDGCVVSAENVNDPKAVICIRVKEGARRPMKLGFLHVRKSEGDIRSEASALANNGGPVLIVEGMSDTAAAMDMGFDAVGRPSNLACMDMLGDLVRGRSLVIIGENDKKSDGREPGREGALAAFQTLKRVCGDVTWIMPPEHIKDLRAWRVKYGLTADALMTYVKEHGQQKATNLVLPDDRPLTIAKQVLSDLYKVGDRYLLCRWEGGWYVYRDGKYLPVKDDEFKRPIYAWSDDKLIEGGKDKLKPLVANVGLLTNLAEAVSSQVLVTNTTLPSWINGASGPDPKDLIVFSNGILHVPAFLDGQPEGSYLLPPTPDLFTTAALPFPFDSTALCPKWEAFLASTIGDELEKVELLREWFGYCMTPDTSFQKMMYLRGPSGAGKSVILNTLCCLIGEEHSSSTSFASLAGDFGIQSLVGKLVCTIPDARTIRGSDNMRGLELLLNISSGDGIQINRKFRDPLERLRLVVRISIASNEFLEVPDHAGAMLRRLNIIEFRRSFVGQEDWGLESKLAAEVPGIAVWALGGLRRLREQNRFTVPPSSHEALEEWKTSTSPLASFLLECTDQVADGEVGREELYDCWDKWRAERGQLAVIKSKFFERVRANAPYAANVSYEKGGRKFNTYRGLLLKKWAEKNFLGRPD